jgi:mycothiol synthase
MDLPDGYVLRAPTPDDLRAVARVLVADELDDAGQVVLDADFLRSEWRRADLRLGTDAWVVLDNTGTIVAYAQVARDEDDVVESLGVVHPAARGLGIGGALVDCTQERAAHLLPSDGPVRFRHVVNAGDQAAAALLRARGLRVVRHFWHMQIDLDAPVAPGRAPRGVRIGRMRSRRDLRSFHAVLDEAFANNWDHHFEPFERWAAERTQTPDHDPSLWLLARSDGEPVGALTASVLGVRGWVNLLGVCAPWRGRGIATALLRRAFAAFQARGVTLVVLGVDAENPTGATALYERAGMCVVKRWDLWERVLG